YPRSTPYWAAAVICRAGSRRIQEGSKSEIVWVWLRYSNDHRGSRMPKTKVLLAEDHTVVAEGLRALLKDSFDLVGLVPDGHALLDAVETLAPDVIVTDISMPLLN